MEGAILATLFFSLLFSNKKFRRLVFAVIFLFILISIADANPLFFLGELLVIIAIFIIIGSIGIRMRKKDEELKKQEALIDK